MKHFIEPVTNAIFAYEEDGSQDHLLTKDLVPISEEDIQAHMSAYTPLEVKISQTKLVRDVLLAQSDWTQLADVPETTKAKWAEYRQSLRDVPAQKTFPESVVWPKSP